MQIRKSDKRAIILFRNNTPSSEPESDTFSLDLSVVYLVIFYLDVTKEKAVSTAFIHS